MGSKFAEIRERKKAIMQIEAEIIDERPISQPPTIEKTKPDYSMQIDATKIVLAALAILAAVVVWLG